MKTALITCGALASEVKAIVAAHGWNAAVFPLPAVLHNHPQRILKEVLACVSELRDKFDRIVVLYADCGTGGALDQVLAPLGIPRISAPHCFELYGRAVFEEIMQEEPGTFFLTDFLLTSFDKLVIKELGLDRFPELRSEYFRHYKRLVYLAQNPTPQLRAKAERVSHYLGLPLMVREVGVGALDPELVQLVGAHAN
jgi:hypothetical protein